MAIDNVKDIVDAVMKKPLILSKEEEEKVIKSFYFLRGYLAYLDSMDKNAKMDEIEKHIAYLLIVYSDNFDEAVSILEKIKKVICKAEAMTF